MTKNELKIGDVVHLKDLPQIDKEFNLPPSPDYLFRVEHIQDGKLTLVSDCSNVRFIVDAELFELVEVPDRKTAFLTELQALLRKYDASIGYFIGDDDKYGWSDYPILKIGNEVIKYPAGEIDEITADNIMDFDKE